MYANSNPVNRIDPSGMNSLLELEAAQTNVGILASIFYQTGVRWFVRRVGQSVTKQLSGRLGKQVCREILAQMKSGLGKDVVKNNIREFINHVSRNIRPIACAIIEGLDAAVDSLSQGGQFSPVANAAYAVGAVIPGSEYLPILDLLTDLADEFCDATGN